MAAEHPCVSAAFGRAARKAPLVLATWITRSVRRRMLSLPESRRRRASGPPAIGALLARKDEQGDRQSRSVNWQASIVDRPTYVVDHGGQQQSISTLSAAPLRRRLATTRQGLQCMRAVHTSSFKAM